MEMESRLLRVELPSIQLTIPRPVREFFDECEAIAHQVGWSFERSQNFTGLEDSSDRLNIYVGPMPGTEPMLRLVAFPERQRLELDIVQSWSPGGPAYDEYVEAAKEHYRALFRSYQKKHGSRLRLGIPRRPILFAPESVICSDITYAQPHFRSAVKKLATGPRDARRRLAGVFPSLSVIRAESLPEPLKQHFSWIRQTLTREAPRWRGDTALEATLRKITNATGAKVAERIVDIADALDEIAHRVCGEEPYFG